MEHQHPLLANSIGVAGACFDPVRREIGRVTMENLIASFHKFCQQTTRTLVINRSDPNVLKAIEGVAAVEARRAMVRAP